MSNLTRIYADACNNPGKTDIVQPYTWLGLMASTDAQKDRYSSYRKMQISSSSKNFKKCGTSFKHIFL